MLVCGMPKVYWELRVVRVSEEWSGIVSRGWSGSRGVG